MQRFLDPFISINCSTCFRRFLRPSSGAQNRTYSVRYCQTNTAANCYRGWDGTSLNASKKMQHFLYLFISINCSTYFRRFLRPSSGVQNCAYSVRYCQTNTAANCYRGWDGTSLNASKKMQHFLYLFISINCSAYFRRFLRPSSGVQNCAYSVRYCQTNTAAWCYREWGGTSLSVQLQAYASNCTLKLVPPHPRKQLAAVLVWQYLTLYVQFCAPDDGRRNRLKHVEQFIEINRSRKGCIFLDAFFQT
jgi:hypothetical protein